MKLTLLAYNLEATNPITNPDTARVSNTGSWFAWLISRPTHLHISDWNWMAIFSQFLIIQAGNSWPSEITHLSHYIKCLAWILNILRTIFARHTYGVTGSALLHGCCGCLYWKWLSEVRIYPNTNWQHQDFRWHIPRITILKLLPQLI